MNYKKPGPFIPKKYVIDADAWAQERFIKRNELGEYFFDSADYSSIAGNPVNQEIATKAENALLSSFLEKQLQLM